MVSADPLTRLAQVLDDADRARADELDRLVDLDDDQVDYLAHVDERPDPASDGLEGRCV